jgi:uncharacterized membrane protein HdeD (DUF308 family)
MNIKRIAQWTRSKGGMACLALIELVLAYIFASLAIDSGSLLDWLLAVLLLFAGLANIYRAVILFTKRSM